MYIIENSYQKELELQHNNLSWYMYVLCALWLWIQKGTTIKAKYSVVTHKTIINFGKKRICSSGTFQMFQKIMLSQNS